MGVIDVENIKRFFKIKKAFAGLIILLFFVFIAVFAPIIAPYPKDYMEGLPMMGPSSEHLLGTTSSGQDIFSLVIWGTRPSLFVGIITGLITTIVSVTVGLTAGYFGGLTDDILNLITNIFLVIPGLPLMIIISAYIPVRGTLTIIFVLAFTGWAWGARVLRSQMLSLKNQEFVTSSVILGESSSHIIFKDILPNMLSLIVANFFGSALSAILGEASLEFLGLGNVNAVTWGTMLYWAQNNQALLMGQWQWLTVPGLCIALLGMSFALMNFAVDEITNPKLRRK